MTTIHALRRVAGRRAVAATETADELRSDIAAVFHHARYIADDIAYVGTVRSGLGSLGFAVDVRTPYLPHLGGEILEFRLGEPNGGRRADP